MIFGYKLYSKTPGVKPEAADFYSEKQAIDDEEAEYVARKAAKGKASSQRGWFYRTFIGWLF